MKNVAIIALGVFLGLMLQAGLQLTIHEMQPEPLPPITGNGANTF